MSDTMNSGPIPWREILDTDFVDEGPCWTTCGGGSCCKGGVPGVKFQLILNQGVNLIFLEKEYEYIKEHGTSHDALEGSPAPQTLTFDFGGDRPLSVVQIPCKLLGLCRGVVVKPLLCRLYPFIPIVDASGGLESLFPGSIFELTDEVMGWDCRCPVMQDKRQIYWDKWRDNPENLGLLRHPYLMFHLACYGIFADSYRRMLPQNDVLAGRVGPDFWHAWELQYLSGRLFDWDEIRGKVHTTYMALRHRHGDFLA